MSRIYSLLLLLLVSLSGYCNSQERQASLIEADSAYNKGDYDKAVALYKKSIDTEGSSAAVLFNLGNACYKSGDEGQAMVSYLRAKKLDPGNSKINENIHFLSSRVEDSNKAELKGKKGDVSPDPLSFFQRLGNTVTVDTSSDYWAVFGAIAFILLLGAIAVYVFPPQVNLKKIGFFSAIIMLFFTMIFTIFAIAAAKAYNTHDTAVMTAFKTMLYEEPAVNATMSGTPLHRGTVFKVLDKEDNEDGQPSWYKVKLNSKNIGWIEAKDVEII